MTQVDSTIVAELLDLMRTRFGLVNVQEHNQSKLYWAFVELGEELDRRGPRLLRWLSGRRDDDPNWAALLDKATTGETHLFRERDQFRTIARELLPRVTQEGQPIRIWSAACSNGAEAWSLAITLADHRLERPHSEDLVLGTDIDYYRLEQARRGVFGNWAFREVSYEDLPGRFKRRGGRYHVRHPRGLRIRFEHHNLLNMSMPAGSDDQRFHLVLCRNAMMYLEPSLIPTVIRSLARSLVPEGYFLVAPAEAHLVEGILAPEQFGDVTVYRPHPPSRAVSPSKPRSVREPASKPVTLVSRSPSPPRPIPSAVPPKAPTVRPAAEATVESIGKTETTGQPEQETAGGGNKSVIDEAALAFASGEGRKALEILRELLYREPENIAALVLRATHAPTPEVRNRSARQALRTLDRFSDDTLIVDLDNSPVGDIRAFLMDMVLDRVVGGRR